MGKNQKDWASRPTAHDSFFKRILHEGLPRKQIKMRMQEKRETTSCRMVNAGILWTKAMCSAPWSVITSAPAECVGFFFFLFFYRARGRAPPKDSGKACNMIQPRIAGESAPSPLSRTHSRQDPKTSERLPKKACGVGSTSRRGAVPEHSRPLSYMRGGTL